MRNRVKIDVSSVRRKVSPSKSLSKRPTTTEPAPSTTMVEATFPAVAQWVRGYGHIEIGDQDSFGFTVRALDYGGLVFEDRNARTLAEAMAALEAGLKKYFVEQGIDIA
jgi:hypothetical protein